VKGLMKLLFVSLLILFLPIKTFASEAASITITKSATAQWTVSFKLQKPASKLDFISNPNEARIQRWKSISNDFIIEYKNNKEVITRKDGALFLNASFILEPTYTVLPKAYSPFLSFSDGGMSIHDGRFFACAEMCAHEVDYLWNMKLIAPESENIIVHGEIYHSEANWDGKDSGSYIYVGQQKTINTQDVVALVDNQLPKELKSHLSLTLPQIMMYFAQQFGNLKIKPTLFASYQPIKQAAKGTAHGGVLPNQIFMHWYGVNLQATEQDENFKNDMIWFFAHEAAHMYQKEAMRTLEKSQAWLQEGGADKFALSALKLIKPELVQYLNQRIDKFKSKCHGGVQDTALVDAIQYSQFKLHYNCGFLIHHSIDLVTKKRSNNANGLFDVWREYQLQIRLGAKANQETYFKVVTDFTSNEHVKLLRDFIIDSKGNFDALVDSFEGNQLYK
jgi:predicted Zn-dependent protease with MMP-like domain